MPPSVKYNKLTQTSFLISLISLNDNRISWMKDPWSISYEFITNITYNIECMYTEKSRSKLAYNLPNT